MTNLRTAYGEAAVDTYLDYVAMIDEVLRHYVLIYHPYTEGGRWSRADRATIAIRADSVARQREKLLVAGNDLYEAFRIPDSRPHFEMHACGSSGESIFEVYIGEQ